MTLYQIKMYHAKTEDLGPGTFRVQAGEAAAAVNRIQETRRIRGL